MTESGTKLFWWGLVAGGASGLLLGAMISKSMLTPSGPKAKLTKTQRPQLGPERATETSQIAEARRNTFDAVENHCGIPPSISGEVRITAMNEVNPEERRLEVHRCVVATGECESAHLDINKLEAGRLEVTMLGLTTMRSVSESVKVIQPFREESLTVDFGDGTLRFANGNRRSEAKCKVVRPVN